MREMSEALTNYWNDVEEAVKGSRLIAWDTCHKIYIAMDEEQVDWFSEHYAPNTFTGTANEMLATLRQWYSDSCPLKFISAVTTNHEDPNAGFESLIPQGAEWEDEEDEDEDDWDED
jgi:hypothetical protein